MASRSFHVSPAVAVLGGLLIVAVAVGAVLVTFLVTRNDVSPPLQAIAAQTPAFAEPRASATPAVISYANSAGACPSGMEPYAVYDSGARVCVNLQVNPYVNGVQVWVSAPCNGRGEDWAVGGCEGISRNEDCEPYCTDGFTPHCGSRTALVLLDVYERPDAWLSQGLDPGVLARYYPAVLCAT